MNAVYTFICRLLLAVATVAPLGLMSQGIPEPSLILYGTIRSTADYNARQTAGILRWSFRNTATGRRITLTTPVTNILDQFSYVLQVSCETDLGPPFTNYSPTVLMLSATSIPFDRADVQFEALGTHPASFVTPGAGTFTFGSRDRGRIERVDLTVNYFEDFNFNGLPDYWERNYFGFVGVDPNEDEDGDGFTNLTEYRTGTNPTDAQSLFEFIRYFAHPDGGFQVEWASAESRRYRLERSISLTSGFTVLQTNILGQTSLTTYRDIGATPPGPYFYRVSLEQ